MKNVLALLLCMLLALTPLASLAETRSATISIDIDVSALVAEMETELKGMTISGVNPVQIAQAILPMLDGASLNIAWQDNAASFCLTVNQITLLDATFVMENSTMTITSSLTPSYAFSMKLEDTSAEEAAFAEGITKAFTSFVSGLAWTESTGLFTGDAYDGGASARVCVIDDADISALIQSMLTDDVKTVLDKAASDAVIDRTNEAAAANEYKYVIRFVEDGDAAWQGMSLTAMRGTSQLATLSAKLGESDFDLVVCLGGNGENYWFRLNGTWRAEDGNTTASGTVNEWFAQQDETFAYVLAHNDPVASYTWNAANEDDHLNASFRCESVAIHLNSKNAKPIMAATGGRTIVDLDSESSASQLEAASEELAMHLMLKLMDMLPLDLLLAIPGILE